MCRWCFFLARWYIILYEQKRSSLCNNNKRNHRKSKTTNKANSIFKRCSPQYCKINCRIEQLYRVMSGVYIYFYFIFCFLVFSLSRDCVCCADRCEIVTWHSYSRNVGVAIFINNNSFFFRSHRSSSFSFPLALTFSVNFVFRSVYMYT